MSLESPLAGITSKCLWPLPGDHLYAVVDPTVQVRVGAYQVDF